MTDPVTRLNAALSGRYRIERQLGEGGMATVLDLGFAVHGRRWSMYAIWFRRALFAAALLTGAIGELDAQLNGGVKVGVSSASFQNDEGSGSRTAVMVGGFVGMDIAPTVGMRLEGLYTMKGTTDGDVTAALDYLEVPLLVRARLGSGVVASVVFAGPAVAFKAGASLKSDGESLEYGDLVYGVDYGGVVGGGLEIGDSRRFAVEARYTHGLRSVFDFGDPDDSDSDDKNRMLSLGVEVSPVLEAAPSIPSLVEHAFLGRETRTTTCSRPPPTDHG